MTLLKVLNLPPPASAAPVNLAIRQPLPFEPGASQQLVAMAILGDGKVRDYTARATWHSSNDAIVKMLPGGVAVAGLTTGKATLSAAAPGGEPRDSVDVQVRAALVDIVVTPGNPMVEIEKSAVMLATAIYADRSTENVTSTVQWRSAKPEVADFIGNTSECTAKAPGFTTIVAIDVASKIHGLTKLTVAAAGKMPALKSVAIEPHNPEIKHGGPVQFTATGTFADKSRHEITQTVTWESSHPDILSVDATGLARPMLRSGRALIRGQDETTGLADATTAYVDFSGIARLEVTPASVRLGTGAGVTVTVAAALHGGGTMDLRGLVKWSSANDDIADVGPGDLIRGFAAGRTVLQALEPDSGLAVSVDVEVLPPVLVEIEVHPFGETIHVGQPFQFSVGGRMSDLTMRPLVHPIWSAVPEDVVRVDQQGVVTALKPGDVVIRVVDRETGLTGHSIEVTAAP
jgi:hypothetical protein